ncbi:glycosyltransferase family 2 protein [Microbacterium sp. MAHUQ-60]|uniref:glycosyltransferase family 2 protein n=1 Tax=unclassified Microbacterium TaxID=2609290 RepID=UPI003618202F
MTDALSVIIPVFDVGEYLPAFLSSLDAQGERLPADIVFIDDGSTDASAELVQRWIDSRHSSARLIRTANLGVSAARNTGLDAVTGDWVLFLDPDDVLGPGYFAALDSFLTSHADVDLVATNLLRLHDPDRIMRDKHPLRFRFAGGTRVANLEDDVFVMNAASVVFPVEAVRASGSRFRTALHASEDALFVVEYLLSLGRAPRAGFVAEATYGYRKRAARTSAVDRYRSDPSTYIVRFRDGYAPLLQATAERGPVPSWLQSILLYEMQWLLPVQMDPQRYAENLNDEQKAETLEALRSCLQHVSEDRLLRYDASALPLESRLLALALTGRPLWEWAVAYGTTPRRWRRTVDVIAYSIDPDTVFTADAPMRNLVTWSPDIFGQLVLVAHRLRADARVRTISGHDIVWPRPGESFVQTQDRHRRWMAGERGPSVPSDEGDVYVRRTRPWATDAHAIRKEIRRRSVWSKDAMIGRALRPGRAFLVEHSSERADLSARLFAALQGLAPSVQSSPKHGARVPGALRFGSFAHRVARARARMLVSVEPTARPSARARLRGLRVLVADGGISTSEALAVRRFNPDLVLSSEAETIDRLAAVGMPAEDVIVAGSGAELLAHSLITRVHTDSRFSSEGSSNIGA